MFLQSLDYPGMIAYCVTLLVGGAITIAWENFKRDARFAIYPEIMKAEMSRLPD